MLTFLTLFYASFQQCNAHFITKICWHLCESDRIMLFQPREYPSAFRALSSPVV